MADNPRKDFRGYGLPSGTREETGPPPELVARAARVVLAAWWIVGPFLLGYGGTFPQRQDMVIGLLCLPLLALGLLVNGVRVVLLAAGIWLVLSPRLSGLYFGEHAAQWSDWITGALAIVLGVLPLSMARTLEKPIVLSTLRLRPRGWGRQRIDLDLPERGIIPAPREGEPRPAMRHGAAVTAPGRVKVEPAEILPTVEPTPVEEAAAEKAREMRNARFAVPPEQVDAPRG